MRAMKNETFGMIKTLLDAHTMGIHASAALLQECGYKVVISEPEVEDALDKLLAERNQKIIINWIKNNKIQHIGISYRLDPHDAVDIVGRFVALLKKKGLYEAEGALVKTIYFAGLKPACDLINLEFNGRISTFCGGETAEETLLTMGVPAEKIPKHITLGCSYDKELLKFGKDIVNKGDYENLKPLVKNQYAELGTMQDSLIKRLDNNFEGGFQPLIRAHSGPYSPEKTRIQCLQEYNIWCRQLASTGYLDILSIGSSQLSQSNFGEDWKDRTNGGGVPVNSEEEYFEIWKASRPMLVRTYSGTKNVCQMAKMYERTINNAWNALSLWWFDELDGRGPNSLYKNLKEHVDTIKYIANIGKPVETNVPHHFAFRGCDDVTYIVSSYLSAKLVKKCGVKTFILQNMLNTPRSTWGIQDLAKSRAMLKLVKELEDPNFRVILQTRTGLDYFKPDTNTAKIQLAAATAMMDDIDFNNIYSPEIIHVVSYSEALFLATPSILNESIKITRYALNAYRNLKHKGMTPNVMTDDIKNRTIILENSARKIIKVMEETIPNLYSPEGLYLAFVAGWLPVPELWTNSDEFAHAKSWTTKFHNGGMNLVEHGVLLNVDTRINKCVSNLTDAEYILKNKYFDRSKSN